MEIDAEEIARFGGSRHMPESDVQQTSATGNNSVVIENMGFGKGTVIINRLLDICFIVLLMVGIWRGVVLAKGSPALHYIPPSIFALLGLSYVLTIKNMKLNVKRVAIKDGEILYTNLDNTVTVQCPGDLLEVRVIRYWFGFNATESNKGTKLVLIDTKGKCRVMDRMNCYVSTDELKGLECLRQVHFVFRSYPMSLAKGLCLAVPLYMMIFLFDWY